MSQEFSNPPGVDDATADALREALERATPAEIPDLRLYRPLPPPPPPQPLPTVPLDDREFADVDPADDQLGVGGFDSIDLVGETVRLYRQTRKLLSKVLSDNKTPVNQQAQVANTLGTLLKGLSAQQTDLYNAERLKRLELIIIQIIRDVAPDVQDAFMARYEAEVNVR